MQKVKDKWLKDGDANTKYFHLTAIIHARKNRISSVKCLNNIVFSDWDSIGNCFFSYYSCLFKSDLVAIPTYDLIKKTLFSFTSNKSPGPDGMPPTFFKKIWNTTKQALVDAIQHFFKTGHLLKALNSTFIALIPKNKNASRVDHYRPISLCNVTYKTISKILASRLKSHLKNCISPFQMAFVAGRNIHDNSIVSHEIVHYLHKKKGQKAFMAIKIDLIKAFDRVEWSLLICILKNLGFSDQFINLINECLSTSSFSFLISGSPFGNLKPSRGIRQGDPISPFLFVIYIEILSRLLAREEMLNQFK